MARWLQGTLVRLRAQDWAGVAIELAVVVLGIVLGLQASDWAQSRRDRAEEREYLHRLLADNAANAAALQRAIAYDRDTAAALAGIARDLADPAAMPDADAMESVLCRWHVHPDLHLQRATYDELLSAGKLLQVTDQALRNQLAEEDASHEESRRLDLLVPAVQRGARPIDAHRRWSIDATARVARCRFDIAALRGDPGVASALAQLYRQARLYAQFRQRELAAAERTGRMLQAALRGSVRD